MRTRISPPHALTTLILAAPTLIAGCANGIRVSTPPNPAFDSVAIGYATVRKRNVTGPVASVTPRESDGARVARVEELLVGRVPGVEVRRENGGGYAVRVRGGTVGDGEPLYVLDGTIFPPGMPASLVLAGISPRDVERIDVLKGAAAAVYGSRGSNGVILIRRRKF
jgi:TonB-dependent SusC/RagA subfamily outer membrane receptor